MEEERLEQYLRVIEMEHCKHQIISFKSIEDEKNGTNESETEGAKFWRAQWGFINDFSTTSCASGLLHKVLRLDI